MSEERKAAPEQDWSAYRGVMIVIEHRRGAAKKVSWQLLGEGRKLADKLETSLLALVIGHDVEHLAAESIQYGADRVYLCQAPELLDYRTRPYSRVCLSAIHEIKPEIVLYGATATGRDLAGAIATHLPTGLTADCTELDVESHPSRLLMASRPAFSEKMMATILCKQYRPQMATARAGVFQALAPDPGRTGEVVHLEVREDYANTAAQVIAFLEEKSSVNLEEADIIVAGGRGLGGPEGFGLLRELAEVLGGEVGATRAAVDAGWITHEHQIGQTGHTVRPKLYIAAGISGAVQHTVGMQGSDVIIAVNKDPQAPIFQIAHYALAGDLFQIIPALTREFAKRRGIGYKAGDPGADLPDEAMTQTAAGRGV
ncbi:electron transfer flavoprotein subunit alpha/FixB family protein [Paenibacillus sp. YN15]|uniref:electron transfer flavoprotein subunit alpha/FixB family protein n=1 Tax=Paenibacillus sp. YN15 TaxID=1742774 RepID=UPI000DCF17A2|nr:electron transfer flavoprotein subunit alpha/FixB family protein [Paenibacillus sp. YN15]RAU97167.1 electron transfer flavoprotein subunit alpha [Paenibacillus sp. YN15]